MDEIKAGDVVYWFGPEEEGLRYVTEADPDYSKAWIARLPATPDVEIVDEAIVGFGELHKVEDCDYVGVDNDGHLISWNATTRSCETTSTHVLHVNPRMLPPMEEKIVRAALFRLIQPSRLDDCMHHMGSP